MDYKINKKSSFVLGIETFPRKKGIGKSNNRTSTRIALSTRFTDSLNIHNAKEMSLTMKNSF